MAKHKFADAKLTSERIYVIWQGNQLYSSSPSPKPQQKNVTILEVAKRPREEEIIQDSTFIICPILV